MEKMTISREEALRVRLCQRKAKVKKHFENVLVNIEAMKAIVKELEKGS